MNGNNDVYLGSGRDTVYCGQAGATGSWVPTGDGIHIGTGQAIMFANDGYHDFDFSGVNHTGLTTGTEDVINDFVRDGSLRNS